MINLTSYFALWRDSAILSLPTIDKRQMQPFEPGTDSLPWATGRALPADISYRVILGTVSRTSILSTLLPLVWRRAQDRPPLTLSPGTAYVAQFAVDATGMPDPLTASLHLSLPAIKAFETGAWGHAAVASYNRAQDDFENKLARCKQPLDYRKLLQLIQWLQGFMPRGCALA